MLNAELISVVQILDPEFECSLCMPYVYRIAEGIYVHREHIFDSDTGECVYYAHEDWQSSGGIRVALPGQVEWLGQGVMFLRWMTDGVGIELRMADSSVHCIADLSQCGQYIDATRGYNLKRWAACSVLDHNIDGDAAILLLIACDLIVKIRCELTATQK